MNKRQYKKWKKGYITNGLREIGFNKRECRKYSSIIYNKEDLIRELHEHLAIGLGITNE